MLLSVVIPVFSAGKETELPHIVRWVNDKAADSDGAFLYNTWAVVDGSLESMQKLVGGSIEMCMHYEDEVALICNDEGKIMGLPLNRSVYDEDGQRIDIMVGTLFCLLCSF